MLWVNGIVIVVAALCIALAGRIIPAKSIDRLYQFIESCDTNAFVKELRRFDRLGDKINAEDGKGTSMLHTAAGQGCSGIVEFLLGEGVQVGLKNKSGETPLKWAVYKGKPEAAAVLLSNGANREIESDKINSDKFLENPTLIAYAAGEGDLKTVQVLKPYYRCIISCDAIDQAMAFAILNDKIEVIKYLLDGSSDLFVSAIIAVKQAQAGKLDRGLAFEIFKRRSGHGMPRLGYSQVEEDRALFNLAMQKSQEDRSKK